MSDFDTVVALFERLPAKLQAEITQACEKADACGGHVWRYGGYMFGAVDLADAQAQHTSVMAQKYGAESPEATQPTSEHGWVDCTAKVLEANQVIL